MSQQNRRRLLHLAYAKPAPSARMGWPLRHRRPTATPLACRFAGGLQRSLRIKKPDVRKRRGPTQSVRDVTTLSEDSAWIVNLFFRSGFGGRVGPRLAPTLAGRPCVMRSVHVSPRAQPRGLDRCTQNTARHTPHGVGGGWVRARVPRALP
jgi:hypothetical protein